MSAAMQQELAGLRQQLQAMERRAIAAERTHAALERDAAKLNGSYERKCQELARADVKIAELNERLRATDLLAAAGDELLTLEEALGKLDFSCSPSPDCFDSDDACCVIRALRVRGWELARTRPPSGEIHITLRPPRG